MIAWNCYYFVRVLHRMSLIFALFIIMVVVAALLHYQRSTYESLEIEQLDELNQDVEDFFEDPSSEMPVVITLMRTIILNGSTPYAKLVLRMKMGNFNKQLIADLFPETKAFAFECDNVATINMPLLWDFDNKLTYFYWTMLMIKMKCWTK